MSEPVAYQQRTRPNWKDESCWTPWENCSEAEAQDCWNRPQVLDWLYEARALYATPQPCPTCEALARSVMMDQTGRDL